MTDVLVLMPSFAPTGPTKGAVAIANLICSDFNVELVCLDDVPNSTHSIDSRVQVKHLNAGGKSRNFYNDLVAYRKHLKSKRGKQRPVSISLCFTPDLINACCGDLAYTVSSIRGNLFVNYYYDFGILGHILAVFHLFMQRFMRVTIVMHNAMAAQVQFFIKNYPVIIPNFVDEFHLEKSRQRPNKTKDAPLRLLFLGSLSKRKRPDLLLDVVSNLSLKGVELTLDFVGTGELEDHLYTSVKNKNLSHLISFCGFVDNVENILPTYDVMILPSMSEGTPRAAMECLFLSVPCVLRNVDGNDELIEKDKNGEIFSSDSDLTEAVITAACISRANRFNNSLLPKSFTQESVKLKYLQLINDMVQNDKNSI